MRFTCSIHVFFYTFFFLLFTGLYKKPILDHLCISAPMATELQYLSNKICALQEIQNDGSSQAHQFDPNIHHSEKVITYPNNLK